jgi:ribosomal protein S18 acetylase RimI-like enzyme
MTGYDDIKFREAAETDLPAIVGMLADDELGALREDAGLPLAQVYLDAFGAIQADQNQRQIVATSGDDIVGILQISFVPGIAHKGAWRGQIESVRVASGMRGSGLGQKLITWAVEQCRIRGCAIVQLTSDKSRSDAIRFYERLGFKASHEGFKLVL